MFHPNLGRSVAKAEAEVRTLEVRLADAEEAESALHRDLRAVEAAAADQDELEAKVAALQERLEETRAVQGQLANYKQVLYLDPCGSGGVGFRERQPSAVACLLRCPEANSERRRLRGTWKRKGRERRRRWSPQ